MKDINTYFSIEVSPKKKMILTVTRGKFKDIRIMMNKVTLGKELPDGGCMLNVDYTVTKNPNGYDVTSGPLEKSFGEYILYVLDQQIKREEDAGKTGKTVSKKV